MRRARLLRDRSDDHGTVGVLDLQGLAPLHTMEPPWRNNRRSRSCIPEGDYVVVPHISPRFGNCLLVTDVPDRSHILFHTGNVGGDVEKGLTSHTAGCILPGVQRGRMKVGSRVQAAICSSRAAFRQLMAWAAETPFKLEITDV